ncbi:MAG: rRNA maturation RNase YbeY [Dehalococcoidia bacterium]|nr:rRNA maturation RNase YbeY [Dehalococcoidia bacterium]
MSYDVTIKIDRPYGREVKKTWLKRVIVETLDMEKVADAEISLVITGDERIHEINRAYRRVDAPTDVIAFALTEETGGEFVSPPDGILHLGEVVISYPTAVRQASEHYHSVQQELAILIVHGTLHLLGYDHVLPGQARKMRNKERDILELLKELRTR